MRTQWRVIFNGPDGELPPVSIGLISTKKMREILTNLYQNPQDVEHFITLDKIDFLTNVEFHKEVA